MIKKKRFLLMCVLALWVFAGAGATALAAQSPQIPLPGKAIPKFVNQLPLLSEAPDGTMQTVFGNQLLTIGMYEFKANVLPAGTPLVDNPLTDITPDGTTNVFGYIAGGAAPTGSQDTYIGPVLVNARNGGSTDITFVNNLPDAEATGVLAFKYGTDQTMHWADPLGVNGAPESNNCKKDWVDKHLYPPFGNECAENYLGPIPAVPHLHGGEVPPELDGGPDAWWTDINSNIKGHAYYSAAGALAGQAIYKYPNTQEAGPIWFHDHGLGITRLNVFAGLAGAYLIHDPALTLPNGLHFAGLEYDPYDGSSVEYTIPLVIQDRMFDTEGQFFYQSDSAGGVLWATNPEHPYWTPEFLGDVIVVNGKAWPNLNVEPKRYRFWLINGSNARTYEMFLDDPLDVAVAPWMWVIATDGGYLDTAAMTNKLVIMPGERYEVIIDFANLTNGTKLVLKNTAKSPYPAGAAVQGATTGQIMQFTVGTCTSGFCGATDASYNPALNPAILPVPMVRLADPVAGTLAAGVTPDKIRLLTLNEVMGLPQIVPDPVTGVQTAYPGGPLEVLVNNTKYGGESPRASNDFIPITIGNDTTYYSELPVEGSTEVWEIVNITADAHPIHLHLVQFQIINRQNFDVGKYIAAYNQAFPVVNPNNFPEFAQCTGQVFCPGYGPPLSVNPSAATGNKWGGNPDVGAVNKGKPLFLKGNPAPPLPQEAGWKDTVVAYPGQVTRLAVRWAPTDLLTTAAANTLYYPFDPRGTAGLTQDELYAHGYVWHCHIIDHEDNEMMRPFTVALNPAAPAPISRLLKKGTDY